MTPRLGRWVFAAAAGLVLGVGIVTQVAPARAARDQAIEAFVARNDLKCVQTADLFINTDAVDAEITNAKGKSGWILDEAVYIGPMDGTNASLNGEVLATGTDGSWVLSKANGHLLGLQPRSVGGVDAFFVHEIVTPC